MPFGEAVTIHAYTAGGRDEYGNPAVTWTDATAKARVATVAAVDDEEGDRARVGGKERFVLHFPRGASVSLADRVSVRGVSCRVRSVRTLRSSFTGRIHGVRVEVEVAK